MARTGIQTGAIIARSRNKTINKLRSMETPLVREVWDTSQLAIPRIVGRPDMGCNVALLATCVGLASIIGWQLTALSPLIALRARTVVLGREPIRMNHQPSTTGAERPAHQPAHAGVYGKARRPSIAGRVWGRRLFDALPWGWGLFCAGAPLGEAHPPQVFFSFSSGWRSRKSLCSFLFSIAAPIADPRRPPPTR